ncbi:MAG TPA: hypothetical protein PKD99_10535 [Sphingopyxis sp.]|nr:hypothetical protein [Sphingopyxis sp.]HMP45532.1 hypothetical protein [Sphingopyxis sp.]HMQ18875.1 hypothetical protein [Sphingopyxis sp.]
MFEAKLEVLGDGEAMEAAVPPAKTHERVGERAGNGVCPHCTYLNYCKWDSGHTGPCHCSNGHHWGYGC